MMPKPYGAQYSGVLALFIPAVLQGRRPKIYGDRPAIERVHLTSKRHYPRRTEVLLFFRGSAA
jgi:hypothetical protein